MEDKLTDKDSRNIYSRSSFQNESEKPLPKLNIENLPSIFTPANITSLYSSGDIRYTFSEFMSKYFTDLGLRDKIDVNELSIIADFHYYNLCFAKDQLLLPHNKTALLLNIMARLINFRDYNAPTMFIKTVDEGPKRTEEEEYKLSLEQKFDELRDALIICSTDNPPYSLRVFTSDDVKKILEYTMTSFFPHFKLYTSVMSNKQLAEQKFIEVYIDEPLPIPPLSEGLIDNPEREELDPKEEGLEIPEEENKDNNEENKEELAGNIEDKPEENAEVQKNINPTTEKFMETKVQLFKEEVQVKISDHNKDFDQTLTELKIIKK